MNIKQWLPAQYLTIPLFALMALTRFHHFGDAFLLPDASLAVFFLAGLGFAKRWWLFALLLVEAALIDYVAITHFNVSSFCVTAASYGFLIPTYAVMWFAGSYCVRFNRLSASEIALSVGVSALATTVAFLISNGSFYLLSGRPVEISWAQYIDTVVQFYPAYTGAALCYVVLGLIAIKLVKSLPVFMENHKAA